MSGERAVQGEPEDAALAHAQEIEATAAVEGRAGEGGIRGQPVLGEERPAEEYSVRHALLQTVGEGGEVRQILQGPEHRDEVVAAHPDPVGAAQHRVFGCREVEDRRQADLVPGAEQAVAEQAQVRRLAAVRDEAGKRGVDRAVLLREFVDVRQPILAVEEPGAGTTVARQVTRHGDRAGDRGALAVGPRLGGLDGEGGRGVADDGERRIAEVPWPAR